MGVYLPIKDYSAMQGPAPDGFHVPTTDEWVALYGILNSTFKLGKNTEMMATYLKMPAYGSRSRSNSNVSGSSGYYWSCSPNPNSVEGAYCMYISSSCNSQYPTYRSLGLGVRCFKNLPAKPTSSWTTLYDGSSKASGAGIFRNSTEGLISASGDGITWYTIMDKNLGATTVYNNGDEKSEANCGGFFQWGNNYRFPFAGTVTTSSTQVNTQNYGPGNYYSSSTFITRSSSPYDWSSVQNDNLWGATTGVKPMSELKNAYIGEYIPNFATQGPAPDGFHVPLNTDRQAVYNVWTALGGGSSAGTNFGIALKLPFAGVRGFSSGSAGSQGTSGYYWSSSRYNSSYAYYIYLYSSTLNPQNYNRRAYGFSVRCFKDSPVIPTSSWTKLYGTSIEAGGIFWSSSEGLISLSSDGSTWLTIADKNLGATTVYNYGDTLSEANCGKFYQRGNNYGFPFTGSVTTSYTRVNASTYGPGNYYSSSTFIIYDGAWDTTDNGNLRGGVDGNVPVD